MISMHKVTKIRVLKTDGLNQLTIAEEVGVHRDTVRKYLKPGVEPRYPKNRSGRTREDKTAAFKEQISLLVKEGYPATEIYDELVPKGYEGSYRSVSRAVKQAKASVPKERFFEQMHEPGVQAQFDFKEKVKIPFITGIRIVHLHFGTLPCSGHYKIQAYLFKNFQCFAHGIASFFLEIKGVTKETRIDNLSPCVKKVLTGRKRLFTKEFQRFVDYYNTTPSACAPAKGNEKGDVEREIRTHAARILRRIRREGLVFENMEDFNQWFSSYCAAFQKNQDKFLNEQKSLQPLPKWNSSVLEKTVPVVPSKTGTVQFELSRYSVPDELIGVACELTATHECVIIANAEPFSKGLLQRVEHKRQIPGDDSIELLHCIRSLSRKPRAMLNWTHRHILFPSPAFTKFLKFLQKTSAETAEREFLASVNLVQHVPIHDIGLGMELICQVKSPTPYEDLKGLLLPNSYQTASLAQPQINLDLNQFNTFIP